MLLKDFFFSLKNIHISHYEKGQSLKLLKVGLTILYKYIFLEIFLYNLFYKKKLDKIYQKDDNLFSQDLLYLFKKIFFLSDLFSLIAFNSLVRILRDSIF